MGFIARAPAKIILTGEHSVVYGQPAIVTAVNLFAEAKLKPTLSRNISFTLSDFKQRATSTIKALSFLQKRLLESYRMCMKGELSIREVLNKPAELFQFAVICLLDTFQMELTKGFKLDVRSDIPVGCGMGSSAATLVSVIAAIANYLKIEVKEEWLHRVSVEAERLQHGFSSGVDSYVSFHGGCVKFLKGCVEHLAMPHFPFYIVNTGKPETSTGDCVMQVAKLHAKSSIWSEFGHLAACIEEALREVRMGEFYEYIRFNHELLVRIGVVPKKVCAFIDGLYKSGITGKLCGAGAVQGDHGGVILCSNKPPKELCDQFGYSLVSVQPEGGGVRFAT